MKRFGVWTFGWTRETIFSPQSLVLYTQSADKLMKIMVSWSLNTIPISSWVLCDSEWSCGGRESLGEGVIKADYGEAEGRGGQRICLPHLMSGGRESWISRHAVVSRLPCHFVTRTLLLEDERGSSACVPPGIILTGWWGPCSTECGELRHFCELWGTPLSLCIIKPG